MYRSTPSFAGFELRSLPTTLLNNPFDSFEQEEIPIFQRQESRLCNAYLRIWCSGVGTKYLV